MLFGICAAHGDIYRAYDGIIIDSKGHKECFLHENRLVRLLTRLMTLRKLPNVFIILVKLCPTWNYCLLPYAVLSLCSPAISLYFGAPEFNRVFRLPLLVVRIKLSVARVLFYHCVQWLIHGLWIECCLSFSLLLSSCVSSCNFCVCFTSVRLVERLSNYTWKWVEDDVCDDGAKRISSSII